MHIEQYISYFRDISTRLVDIAHNPSDKAPGFYRGSVGEMLNALESRDKAKFGLWVEPPIIKPVSNDGDQLWYKNPKLCIYYEKQDSKKVGTNHHPYPRTTCTKKRCANISVKTCSAIGPYFILITYT